MKRKLLFILLASIMVCSCGTSYKRTLSDYTIDNRRVMYSAAEMVIYLDDPARTRKNADKVFDSWIQSRNMQRTVTGRRLLSVATKEDGCNLIYDFRMVDGTQQRVTLVVPEFRQQYRKKRNRNSMFVNGRIYNL